MSENVSNFETFVEEVKKQAIKFGWKEKDADSGNAIWRDNTNVDKVKAKYFGFILPNNTNSGPYSDLSFVVFPNNDYTKVLVAIGVGTNGFVEDYENASIPKWRRAYLKLLPKGKKYYSQCKISFTDIETSPDSLKNAINDNNFSIGIFDSYGKLLPVSFVADIKEKDDKELIYAWLAQYAKLRGWDIFENGNVKEGSQKKINSAIELAQKKIEGEHCPEHCPDLDNVRKLLKNRRYVILQGAPGVGKTYLANEIANAKEYKGRVIFTQFHAETSYTDFVGGILPVTTKEDVNSDNDKEVYGLAYKRHKGTLVKAIEAAVKDKDNDYLLIIDEINRANLANVLGPVFYLFEQGGGDERQTIEIGDVVCSHIPNNLYVIGTMNTADRSLAVVDYALRRRFAWYTIASKPFDKLYNNEKFHDELFKKFDTIFQSYATDEELNLQPGPSYFKTEVASNVEDKDADHKALMKERMEYELMPLIKEYLNEGLLSMARNEFATLFYNEIEKLLYK